MNRRQTWTLGLVLLAVTFVVYWPSVFYEFTTFDDDLYIVDNPWVKKGLCLETLKWAFTTTHAANWHPITWISHLIDYSMYGDFAGGHHLTSVIFHSANSVLLFILLKKLTGRPWLSWMTAALFAWHPVHVESVAWVAERKDVLSTFFFLLMLMAYTNYAQNVEQSEIASDDVLGGVRAKRWLAYLACLVIFAIGLLCKPMLVTAPFLLLLLDYWPLRRLQFPSDGAAKSETGSTGTFSGLLAEKLPFFALALVAGVITLLAQRGGGALRTVEEVPIGLRALNAVSAYGHYIVDMVCPSNLCVFYPLTPNIPVHIWLSSVVMVGAITCFAVRFRSKFPWALMGWSWFLASLVPVIGLIQVGGQAMADRYTYIPSIGLLIVLVWATAHLTVRLALSQAAVRATAIAVLGLSLVLTRTQLGYWHDSVVLCEHAISVTQNNAMAENNLGVALAQRGRTKDAILHYERAVKIKPDSAQAHYNLGILLAGEGEFEAAAQHFSCALVYSPNSEMLQNNLGVVLVQQGKIQEGIKHFQEAVRLNPQYPKPCLNLAMAYQSLGRGDEASLYYSRAMQLDPAWPDALDNFAFMLCSCPDNRWKDPPRAIRLAKLASDLTHQEFPRYLGTLAMAYASADQFTNAVLTARTAHNQALKLGFQSLAKRLDEQLEGYTMGRRAQIDWKIPSSSEPGAGAHMPTSGVESHARS